MTLSQTVPLVDIAEWRKNVLTRVEAGARFAGLYGTARPGGCEVTALLAEGPGIDRLPVVLVPDADRQLSYPALTPQLPAAFWYERALHDLSGVRPIGHPRLDPLLLPLPADAPRPLPGQAQLTGTSAVSDPAGPVDVTGHGMFTIAFGPVRSGVFESVELLLETPGEDIPHLNVRPHYKHRGVAKRFEGQSVDDGVLVAERVEGIASVAHAMAFCHAVETLAATVVPARAQLLRVVHAELERIANHLDVAVRLCDAAGLAVATARFSWHKENVMRLVSRMCGSRFGRGLIVPGGVRGEPALSAAKIEAALRATYHRIRIDTESLMDTPSFLDRLRTTGRLDGAFARSRGALGPIGRGSGFDDDDRRTRSYDAYPDLPTRIQVSREGGDALARLRVRWAEIDDSVDLVAGALALSSDSRSPWRAPVPEGNGVATGWAEAPQGEVLYDLQLDAGRIVRCLARSASFHNLVLFHSVFHGDITTDLPFIEASFGLSYAGVAM